MELKRYTPAALSLLIVAALLASSHNLYGQPQFYPGTGHYYELVRSSISWDAARAAAAARTHNGLQGYLATITSADENNFVSMLNGFDPWLGGSDVAQEGVWRWVTGPEGLAENGAGLQFWQGNFNGHPVNGAYTNWNAGEPNGVQTAYDEDYLLLYLSASRRGKWNDGHDSPGAYLVEYGGLENGDGTPPVCGPIQVERDASGQLTAVQTNVSDPESGLLRVTFTRLRNMNGLINNAGSYHQGDAVTFDPASTPAVTIRGERISMTTGGAIVVQVLNGTGLSSQCDPIFARLSAEVPASFELSQNYPNPFNPTTHIQYRVAEEARVSLVVYDILGREIVRLVDDVMTPGTYVVAWDSRDGGGAPVPSGVYVYQLKAGSFLESRTMMLSK